MVPLKAEDATAFRKLFNFLIKCQSIEFDDHYNPLDTPEIICTVLSKLPLHLPDRWSRNTLQLRRKYSKQLQLIGLANVFEDEITLVNDPLYSRDAISQYVDRAPRQSEKRVRKKFDAMATAADNSCNMSHDKSNKVASKVEMCPMCNENHDIEDCTYYLQQTMEERSKLLFKNKLCYGCLKTVTKPANIGLDEDILKTSLRRLSSSSSEDVFKTS